MLYNARNRISGVVLAGGENKRFPALKSHLKINGVTLIERGLELLRCFCDEVFINTNNPELYSGYKTIMCGDVLPSRGPMSGIHSALMNAANQNLFVIACDMPFLKEEVLFYICQRHFESLEYEPYDATIPVYNGKVQPLCGIYRKTVLVSLERHIFERRNSMYLYLGEINTNFIAESEINELDPHGSSFININTISDYETIRRCEGGFILTI
jgi:molybdopterin-guanine dinucleotide biosynthesis protein A